MIGAAAAVARFFVQLRSLSQASTCKQYVTPCLAPSTFLPAPTYALRTSDDRVDMLALGVISCSRCRSKVICFHLFRH